MHEDEREREKNFLSITTNKSCFMILCVLQAGSLDGLLSCGIAFF